MSAGNKSVQEMVVEFLGGHLVPPQVIQDPESGRMVVVPAAYDFDGESAPEYERIARAASAASGILPTPEDLTGEVMAKLQAAQSGQAPGG